MVKIQKGNSISYNFSECLVEPDGSIWYHICHHANPTTYKFSSSNDFTNGVYIDENRWFHASILNELTSWEILWIQQATQTSEFVKLRWTQTKNPFTATYEDVAPDKITFNTSTGYTIGSGGGMYKLNSSTFFCCANETKGNWWGAAGAWNGHQGGIPGYPNQGIITTGGIDVYVKIDTPKTLIHKIQITDSTSLIEK